MNISTITIKADWCDVGDPKDSRTHSPIRIKSGDDTKIRVLFFNGGEAADVSEVACVKFEVLDIGERNSAAKRSPKLLISKVLEASKMQSDVNSGTSFAEFTLNASETSLTAGEKWLRVRTFSTGGEVTTYLNGWIDVIDTFSEIFSDEEIDKLPYLDRDTAFLSFCRRNLNLSDLANAEASRENLNVYSEEESDTISETRLEKNLNLADIPSPSLARENLDVYSKSEISTALEQKLNKDTKINGKNLTENLTLSGEDIALRDGDAENLVDAISALQTAKLNSGALNFIKGSLKTSNSVTMGNFPVSFFGSFAFNANDDKPRVFSGLYASNQSLSFGVYNTGSAYRFVFQISHIKASDSTQQNAYGYFTNVSDVNLDFTKPHNYICIFRGYDAERNTLDATLYIDGVAYNSKKFNDIYAFEFTRKQATFVVGANNFVYGNSSNSLVDELTASRCGAFDFDMSAEDAPYSVEDYNLGKAIPPTLLAPNFPSFDENLGMTTGDGWTQGSEIVANTQVGEWRTGARVRYIKNHIWADGEERPAEVVHALELSTVFDIGNTISNAFLYNTNIDLSPFANKRVLFKYDFWARRLNDNLDKTAYFGLGLKYATIQPRYGCGIEKGDTTWHHFVGESYFVIEQNSILGVYAYIDGNPVEPIGLIANLKVEIKNAEVALENYTFTKGTSKVVPDYSGNMLEASVTGAVSGDNDNHIQALTNLIISQIPTAGT